jgi:hypothetical protein
MREVIYPNPSLLFRGRLVSEIANGQCDMYVNLHGYRTSYPHMSRSKSPADVASTRHTALPCNAI